MHLPGRVGLSVILLLASAGCLGAEAPPAGEDPLPAASTWVERSLPNGDDHDHFDAAQHAGLSTANFELLGWDPLATDHYGASAGGYFCGDLAEKDGRTLAVVHSFTSDVAFVLLDVTDPARPTKIGELVMEHTHVWDVAMTPDQRHVVLATSPFGEVNELRALRGLRAPPTIGFRDACTGEIRPLAGPEAMPPYSAGVLLVGISDPKAPVVLDHRPLPVFGGHSVVAQDVGGETIVLVTVGNARFANYYAFLGLIDTPLGARLVTHSLYQTDASEAQSDKVPYANNHDGYLQEHPITGQRLAYLADGNYGVTILDLADPKLPRVLARWDEAATIANPDPEHFAHSILPVHEAWDGRHYTFVSEECAGRPTETPTCLVYVLDTTDPASPTLAGAWTLPHELGSWNYPGFSPHYMVVIDRTLFLAHWHAGLWALDVSTPEAIRTMPIIGAYVPDRVVKTYESSGIFPFNMAPVVADVLVHGKNVVIFDGLSGAYVLRFDATRPAPSPEPWPLTIGA